MQVDWAPFRCFGQKQIGKNHHVNIMEINSIDQLIAECSKRGLQAPSALKPEDKDFPIIVGASFPEARENKPFFADYELDVVWGFDETSKKFVSKRFVVRSNYNGAGAIALAVVDGKIGLFRQWRVNLGRYTWEVPRGFSEKWESGAPAGKDTLPKGLATALREAAEEVGTQGCSIVPRCLGEVAENSGTGVGSPAYWLLEMKGFQASNENVRLVTLAEAIAEAADNHTCTALFLYQRFLLTRAK
jgi:hypothetical protein